jgi:hypothetical protein
MEYQKKHCDFVPIITKHKIEKSDFFEIESLVSRTTLKLPKAHVPILIAILQNLDQSELSPEGLSLDPSSLIYGLDKNEEPPCKPVDPLIDNKSLPEKGSC